MRARLSHVPRPVAAFAASIAVVGLLIVVAVAARGSHPGGHGRIAQRQVPARVSDDLLTILLAVYVLGTVALIVGFILYRSRWQEVESHWLRSLLTSLLMFTLIAAFGYRLFHSRALHRRAEAAAQRLNARKGQATRPGQHLRRVTSGGAHFDTTLGLGLLGLLVVGGAMYYVRMRASGRPALEPISDVKTALTVAVSDAIEDLENEPDARRAVIAAYARMERALAEHGYARRPSEAPFEYLARILGELAVRADAVRALTELFERAKFSTHAVDDVMKQRAISALLAIKDDLARPAVAA